MSPGARRVLMFGTSVVGAGVLVFGYVTSEAFKAPDGVKARLKDLAPEPILAGVPGWTEVSP